MSMTIVIMLIPFIYIVAIDLLLKRVLRYYLTTTPDTKNVDGKGFNMANLAPASNVQAATIAGFIAVLIEHICSANGIIIPEDVSSALPGILIIIVAHGWDVLSGDNKPAPTQNSATDTSQK